MRPGVKSNASAVSAVLPEIAATGRLTTNKAEPSTVATKLKGRTTVMSAATASNDPSSQAALVAGVTAAKRKIVKSRMTRVFITLLAQHHPGSGDLAQSKRVTFRDAIEEEPYWRPRQQGQRS